MPTYEIIKNDGTHLVVRELNSLEEEVLTMYENPGCDTVSLYDEHNAVWITSAGLCKSVDYMVNQQFQLINVIPEPNPEK